MEVVFVAIVPLALPNEYLSVCVNDDDALVIEIVVADPIFTFDADRLDARGIESNVTDALAVIDS